ncbi:hypothetical protein QFC19_007308 [Naganishia cerealis]|uniref:Uncharacterized protein n=1 Tax=Naganishia cerealis TaxID=610337 RepID=A0ACC2VC65_9TREE|nr:hypothetical protein QFC19_007308 [Naganishia cerealis]
MTLLQLAESDVNRIRNSWADLQTNNRYHKDQFISRLFANLIAGNAELKSVFYSDSIVREQSTLFGDLLNMGVVYLDEIPTLDRFMNQFFREHLNMVDVAVHYLEPMGVALIQTFRQWLGKGKFDSDLESKWIQLYIYIANSLLQFSEDDSDVDDAPSTPTDAPQTTSLLDRTNTIEFQISSNDKYRGFRRNDQLCPEPIAIKVPTTFSTPTSTPAPSIRGSIRSVSESTSDNSDDEKFDPRRRSRRRRSPESDAEPMLTPRSSRRPSIDIKRESVEPPAQEEISPVAEEAPVAPIEQPDARKMGFARAPRVITDAFDKDDDFAESDKSFGFDPRQTSRRKSRSPSSEVESEEDVAPLFTANREEEKALPETPVEPKASRFDHTSFGIKGLAPIVEGDFDDDAASSRYASDEDNSSSNYGDSLADKSSSDMDEVSSGVSTLSLHNSDFRSSIGSSSSPPMRSHKSNHRQQSSMASDFTDVSVPSTSPKLLSSANMPSAKAMLSPTPSLLSLPKHQDSTQMRQRVSLGFMRSSFVLKKEMEQLGYNQPEHVDLAKPPTIPAAVSSSNPYGNMSHNGSRTSHAVRLQSFSSSDLQSRVHSLTTLGTNNGSSAKNVGTTKYPTRSLPVLNASSALLSTSRGSMMAEKKSLKSRFSKMFKSKKKDSSLTSASVDDLASMMSAGSEDSTMSGFSFLSKRGSSETSRTRGAKNRQRYNVSSVPYNVLLPQKPIRRIPA